MSGLTDSVDAIEELRRGRSSYSTRAWKDAYESLSRADRVEPLGPEDLEMLATTAYMIGREEEYFGAIERSHHAFLEAGEVLRAAHCAFWIGMNLALQGMSGPASGWLSRAQRLVEREERDCVERGYLLLPVAVRHEAMGDYDSATAVAADAAEIGERFGDRDLFALAVHEQGCVLIKGGRVQAGLGLLDEAMVAVSAGELSPIVSGIVYCGVILGCQDAYDLRRAQEWTAALTAWCEEQPEMVAFTGRCLLHRAEIMQLHGDWPDAVDEARRAARRCEEGKNPAAAAEAIYRHADVHRLQGEFTEAEEAYRDASREGLEPQPGLALLRLSQGKNEAAAAAIRRVAEETTDGFRRAAVLPAAVEILLAVGDRAEASSACRELEEISAASGSDMVDAMAAHARGAVALAEDDAQAALAALRSASQAWQRLRAPYEVARARVLIALACRALGDDDAAALELDAARAVFEELGAAPDLARVDSLAERAPTDDAHGLTPRELEVLRFVAAGETNKAIAAQLILSERTVDRHVSNIFAKLGVSSRAAATAYAYEHQLV
jgi:DNA-binding NarL/FixJ family response regulator